MIYYPCGVSPLKFYIQMDEQKMNDKTYSSGKIAEVLYMLLYTVLLFPAVLKFGSVFFVDLRFQQVVSAADISSSFTAAAFGVSLLAVIAGREIAKRSGADLKESFAANLPLTGCGIMWFLSPSFPLLILNILLMAWSAGRTAAIGKWKEFKNLDSRRALWILSGVVMLYALVGTYQQCHSLDCLAMSWFDWGHFYECLNNFFRGKPFYLNLNGGSFLGSRFSPSLILLLPVVATGCVPLFFFAGSLMVASGAIFVYLIARSLKMTVNEALVFGIWYLLIPGVANMNLPLLDGPHEVFMLFPLIPAAVWCAVNKKVIAAAVLILLAMGVRETTGIIAAGYGIILWANKQKKAGITLLAAGIIWVIVVMKILMPLFDPPVSGTYAHVGFYSHLGNNIVEIALSPVLKPAVFWKALFNSHTFLYWCTLLLPFAVLIWKKPLLLLPVLPEFIMVSVDRRFDTQTVVRHYQAAILIVLVIAALYGAAKLRSCEKIKVLFAGLKTPQCYRGCVASAVAAAFLSSVFFVQYPGLPASDPQRRVFNNGNVTPFADATGAIARFKALIPAGAKITSGPMFASALIPDYDIHFKFEADEKTLQDHVLLENFSAFEFPEDKLSRYLHKSPNWQLVHQEFVAERSFQLFKRTGKPVVKKAPVVKIPEKAWQSAGQLIPLPETLAVEVRAAVIAAGKLRIGARIKAPNRNDAGFKTAVSFADGTFLIHFTSFCNGKYPADLAETGDAFFYVIEFPADKQISSCRIDVMELKSITAPN